MGAPIRWRDLSEAERCALVAEKVMGWTLGSVSIHPDKNDEWFHRPAWLKDGKPIRLVNKSDGYPNTVWQPISSIADAWKVIAAMGVQMQPCVNWLSRKGQWHAHFYGQERDFDAYADFAPEAICLAALRAKGLEIDTDG